MANVSDLPHGFKDHLFSDLMPALLTLKELSGGVTGFSATENTNSKLDRSQKKVSDLPRSSIAMSNTEK